MGAALINSYRFAVPAGPPFTPPDIAGLVAWYDASAITGLSDGDPVASWADESGNGQTATQADATKQPVYKTGIVNGLPVLRFDGSNDHLVSGLVRTQPYTAIAVVKATTGGNEYYLDGASQNQGIATATGSGILIYAGGVLTGLTVNMAVPQVVSTVFNGASSLMSSGGSTVTGDAGTGNTTGTTIGSDGAGTNCLNGDIAEMIFYDTALSTPNRQLVEGYLGAKYGIAV